MIPLQPNNLYLIRRHGRLNLVFVVDERRYVRVELNNYGKIERSWGETYRDLLPSEIIRIVHSDFPKLLNKIREKHQGILEYLSFFESVEQFFPFWVSEREEMLQLLKK